MKLVDVKHFCCVICVLIVVVLCLGACRNDPADSAMESSGKEESTSAPADTDVETPKLPEKAVSYSLTQIKDQLKINGRYSVLADGITCDHTASGIEFSAYCEGDVTLTLSGDGDSYFSVWIDGVKKRTKLYAEDGESTVTVAKYLEEGVHTFRIAKQTESRLSRTVLKALTLRGTVGEAPKDRSLYIEFVGDSITSGHGNLTTGKPVDVGSALYEDGTQSYAFLTAEALDADCSVVSCSGIGVSQGYVNFNIADFYSRVSYYRNTSEQYTPVRVPDAVVINLGTNDFSKQANAEEFSTGVKDLISQIRTLYGEEVPIVWAYNMMNEGYNTLVRTVLKELGGAEAGLFTISLIRETSGGNGHPSVSGHTESAKVLSQYLRKGLTDGVWGGQGDSDITLEAESEGTGMSLSWGDGLPKTENNN